MIWKNREKDIQKIIKEYFDNLADASYCADFLQNSYTDYLESKKISLNLIEIPYSIVLSVKILADIDIYDTITMTEDIDLW